MSGNGILMDAMFGYVRHYRTAQRRKRGERVLNDLPAHIRKDIGWPTTKQYIGEE